MSYREFIDWQHYYNDEPFLADRLEIQMARVGQITSYTGMGKMDLPENFFFVSNDFKNQTTKETSKVDLAAQVKAAFGVK